MHYVHTGLFTTTELHILHIYYIYYSNPQSRPHLPYITFFPLLGNIHLSLDYESPQNFLASHQNQKIPIILLTCSLPLSDFIIVFFSLYLLFFVCLFLCLLSTIIVQPLAITFNKRYKRPSCSFHTRHIKDPFLCCICHIHLMTFTQVSFPDVSPRTLRSPYAFQLP